ncbi:4Fe-4S binding protein [Methanococcus maripaludis]|uniref:4Fe-4S binding protein n=1 Tax=Methanococcus maripaludis TaxID=39152 RepID=A0A8T3W638_METMI|nr:4Fe-4S binding protein [Methanococcus maripaludis]MBG0769062.1 4Fe-4S binding protein [Methanococcus maripaludis]
MITVKKPVQKIISDISKNLGIDEKFVKEKLKDLIVPVERNLYVESNKCIRCELCYEMCPVDAIKEPSVKSPAEILPEKCVKCEICAKTCPVGAINVLEGRAKLEEDNVVYELKEIDVTHRKIRLVKHELYEESCIKCGICERFCPTSAITVEKRNSININLNLCMGCTACEKVCPKSAIKVENEMGEITAENEISLNNDTCINCMVCSEICPVGAIVYEDGLMKLDDKMCILCGKCEKNCPVTAIAIKQKNM